jgi:hypothetical protein
VFNQHDEAPARQDRLERVLGVASKGHQHLLGDPGLAVVPGILGQLLNVIFTFLRTGVELRPRYMSEQRHITVKAPVAAPVIGVGRERGVFIGLPARRVDEVAAFQAHAVRAARFGFGSLGHDGQFTWSDGALQAIVLIRFILFFVT